MPKKLLIISDGFNRPLYGPRMTQLCKFLNAKGWDITLITEQINGENYAVPNCRFMAMPYYSKNHFIKYIQWLLDKLFGFKDYRLYSFAKKKLSKDNFSLILCSSFNLFPLPTAYRIAIEEQVPFIVDLRDITEQWNSDSYIASKIHLSRRLKSQLVHLYENKCIRTRNTILQHADCVTTISPWHQQFLRNLNPNTLLIYNGFDPDLYYPTSIPTQQCIISYIGRLYDFKSRNPQLFLEAIRDLDTAQLISPTSLHIEFHIEPYMVVTLQEWVKQLGIAKYFHISGYIPRTEAFSLLQKSSISLLFVAAPSSTSPHGVMTTKFFEALGCEKPILCCPSDEGCLAQAIHDTNAGLASSDLNEIKAFILDKYHEWQAKGYTHQSVVNKDQFSRQHQAEQFEELFLSLINK